ncbi:hypothetical protein MAR_024537 [Mya arenaria]|uniref:Uncharacterized protein n=1 Tax=Mya arenaria TaxID=6604 RepID=A0ABY7DRZ6_MYAAR|nr:hypothetical protein MAR_024537 [Mya arenaria]
MKMELSLTIVVTIILINGFYAASLSGIDITLQTDPHSDRHHHYQRITLKHFSEHALCRNTRGKITFLTALEDYFQNISGDGYISHFERIFYNYRIVYGEGIWKNNLLNDV